MSKEPKAAFTTMAESTRQDWEIIVGEQMAFWQGLPERILQHMTLLGGDYGGFPVDRLQHCLQTAHLAAEAGEDDEYVVCALLHDVGDTLGSTNHADVSAAILQPFVSADNHWMVKHHAIFQGYNFFHHIGLDRHLRDRYNSNQDLFERTERFVARYDNPAFDAGMPKLKLELFEPMVRDVFRTPKHSLYKAAMPADSQ